MKIKTAEAIGPALDWLVESIEIARMRAEGEHVKEWWVEEKQTNPTPYSTNPLWSWPIIEREKISTVYVGWAEKDALNQPWAIGRAWEASFSGSRTVQSTGPTSLIAAMRRWVASKLGDEVEVPEELT